MVKPKPGSKRVLILCLGWLGLALSPALRPARAPGGLEDSIQDVWLDVDPAIGLHEAEVDDGLALIQAFHSAELHIGGVSVVFGNTSLERAVPIARRVVRRFGPRGLAVAPGAASPRDLGRETPAVKAMAQALRRRPMTLLALGPVTNVATLVERHPELHSRIRAIVMVAARRPGQKFLTGDATHTPHRDFNFELDPAAMQVILDTEIPLVFAPWEVSSQVWVGQQDLDALRKKSKAGRWVARQCQSWLDFWRRELGTHGFNPFDTLAVAWVTHPQLVETMEVGVWIEEREDDRAPGGDRKKPYLLVDPERRDRRRAIYSYRPSPRFHSLLMRRLAGEG